MFTFLFLLIVGIIIFVYMLHNKERKREEEEAIRQRDEYLRKEMTEEEKKRQQRNAEERARVLNRRKLPQFRLRNGIDVYYPLLVIGTNPISGMKKHSSELENRFEANVEVQEMLERGVPIIQMIGKDKNGEWVEWGRINGDKYIIHIAE